MCKYQNTGVSECQDVPPFLFVLLLHDQRKYIGWVLINVRSVEVSVSVDKLKAWNKPEILTGDIKRHI